MLTWPTPQNVKQPYLYLKFRLKGTVPHTPPPPPPKGLSSCQDSLGFWIPHCGFRKSRHWIPVFVSRTWILNSNR